MLSAGIDVNQDYHALSIRLQPESNQMPDLNFIFSHRHQQWEDRWNN
jgi:hypothetical protein